MLETLGTRLAGFWHPVCSHHRSYTHCTLTPITAIQPPMLLTPQQVPQSPGRPVAPDANLAARKYERGAHVDVS